MSDLKYKTLEELQVCEKTSSIRISSLKSQLAGEIERLKWIKHYIEEKTVHELTIKEIEAKLGHRVIIKS